MGIDRRRRRRGQGGQGMLEYALIMTALGLMLMATVNIVGRAINGTYCQISVGLSLTSGAGCTVSAWGYGGDGELGNNAYTTNRATPAVIANLGPLLQLSAGMEHNEALAQNGTVWTWGLNNSGQLGSGGTTNAATPQHITFPANFTNIAQVAAGSYESIALKSDGTLWTWGDQSQGEGGGAPGAGGSCPVSIYTCPSAVPMTFDATARPTAVGSSHMNDFALMSDGTVWVWGTNQAGTIGNGVLYAQNPADGSVCGAVCDPVPTESIFPGNVRITQVVGNQADTMYALGADGNVYAWGDNTSGQIGNNLVSTGCYNGVTNTCNPWPTIVQLPGYNTTGSKIVFIAGGDLGGYAIDATGNVYAWGDNSHYQLGDGTNTQRPIPVRIATSSMYGGIVAIAGGGQWMCCSLPSNLGFALALTKTGSVLGWGDNTNGELGPTASNPQTTPLSIPGETKVNAVVTAGFATSYSINTKETGSG